MLPLVKVSKITTYNTYQLLQVQGPSDRIGPGACPRIESHESEILVPSGKSLSLTLSAHNLQVGMCFAYLLNDFSELHWRKRGWGRLTDFYAKLDIFRNFKGPSTAYFIWKPRKLLMLVLHLIPFSVQKSRWAFNMPL